MVTDVQTHTPITRGFVARAICLLTAYVLAAGHDMELKWLTTEWVNPVDGTKLVNSSGWTSYVSMTSYYSLVQ